MEESNGLKEDTSLLEQLSKYVEAARYILSDKHNLHLMAYVALGGGVLGFFLVAARVVNAIPIFNDFSSVVGAGFILYWTVPAANRAQSMDRLYEILGLVGLDDDLKAFTNDGPYTTTKDGSKL